MTTKSIRAGLRIGKPFSWYDGTTLLWRCSCGQEHTGHWHGSDGHKPLVNIRKWLPIGTKVRVTCGNAKDRIYPVAGYMDDPLATDVLLDDGMKRYNGEPWPSRCSIFNLKPIRKEVGS